VTLPLFEETYTVSALGAEVRDFLGEAFRSVWVAGEIQRPVLRGGHLYFDLVEKGPGDKIAGKLEAVLWRTDGERVRRVLAASGQQLQDGLAIRCRADLDFYPPQGRLRLQVREVDPVFTEGELARRRRETLLWLEAEGHLGRNRALALADLPLRLGLVTATGSAAAADFLATLRESGFGFKVVFVHAAVQGPAAEREIASALRALSGSAIDCALLVRGGGSRADLQAFDSRSIALAVAQAPFPVLTGLGHELDDSVADRAAHLAFKTPTKAAEFLVERVAAGERRLAELRRALVRAARLPLAGRRETLAGMAARLRRASKLLQRLAQRVSAIARGLQSAATRRVNVAATLPAGASRRLADLATAAVRLASARLEGQATRARLLDPLRTLERGYSITRCEGRLLRAAAQARPGERLSTRLADGVISSIVEES
jgi:exodeoxyribonuclease VII large subunit